MPEFEYYEGTKVIQHEDGSTTYIQTTHEPYVEPLSKKEQWALLGVVASMTAGVVALPFIVDRLDEWSQHRKEVRKIRREKKLAKAKTEAAE